MESVSEKAILNIMENSPDKYFCTLCSPVYPICSNVSHTLELHIRSTHPESRSLRCMYCSELVPSVSISRHIDMHFCSTVTQNLPYACPCCPRSYGTMKALAQHALSLHNIDKRDVFFKCGHCDKPVSSPMELKSHLCKYSLILFRCCFPNCHVMSKNVEVMKHHSLSFHGTNSPLINTSHSFMCSWPSSILPTRIRAHSPDTVKLNRRVPSTFFCAHCSFGTAHLENFAQHLAVCRAISSHLLITSLSVTCVLHRCSECGWMTNVRNMLTEHLQDMHPLISEEDGVITEDFTVPISDESITENYNFISKNMETLRSSPLQQLPSFFSSGNPTFLHTNNGAALRNDLPLLYSAASNLSAEVSKHLSNVHGPSSIDSCEADEVGDHEEHVRAEVDNDDLKKSNKDVNLNNRPISSNLPPDVTEPKPEIITETTAEEYVQLYFNEQAFVSAYIKNEKFNISNNDTTNDELNNVLEKLRRFASYRVPILGRANQRRVAGCPECLKPFNHGFTDLKKHLLVTHLGVRRDISRFTIDFTHSGRSHNSGIPSQTNNSLTSSGSSPQSKHSFGIRNGRLSSKAFRRKPFPISSLSPLCKRPTSGKYEDSQKSPTEPLATTSSDSLPALVTSGSSYSGGAPVHRVIPGTGVSDHHEDMRSLEEVSAQAPIGRGGIIPLDEMGNPIVAAVVAAGQPQTSTYSGGTEIFLPKVGRQRVQLAYSFPVFKRLLEAYQVPMPERIQLVNRMNHYARMHVIMDVLVPGGAQKRFSCPTCMYTSVHSLADIRKHIMGSHCGISTKRFRLCLRASRHDTTTYRLHSDDRMIRFVEDHRRRQIQLTDARATIKVTSTDSDTEETKEESSETHSQLMIDENNNISNEFSKSQVSFNDQEELETQTIETDVYDDSHHDGVQGADEESDNRFLTANTNSDDNFITPSKSHDNPALASSDNATTYSDENIKQNEELHRRIELPFSDNVLHVLLEREGMLDQYDDLVVKMQIYSKHHLTVVSRGNRIYSYICICGRRFAVVRDEVESDIRPASLADCRRHILGVHARIPQELLTLCCQASRISKESGYKLYADSSLLALAEQHKFRSTRIQSYSRKSEGGISPIKRPLEPMIPTDVEGIPEFSVSTCSVNSVNPRSNTSYSSMSFNHSAPSQVALHHSSSYSSNHPLPPMLRAPTVKYELNELDESPPSEYSRLNGKTSSTTNLSKKSPEPNPYTFEERHSGLDLEAPRRMLTPEESVTWSQKLGLPTSWALERIVRLLYSPAVFDHQVRSVLPDGDNFIASLHERMKVYARHSVYITRMRETPNLTQRIYVCCACLTTSHHGFGDVRKHILGVHAHVPERFKSAAMCSSRLNRDDYFLYTDSQLLLLANSPGRNVNISTLGAASNKTIPPLNHSPGPQKHRQYDSECISPQNTPSRKRRCSGNESDSIDFGIKPEHSSQFLPDESSHTVHLNGHTAFSPDMPAKSYEEHDEHRPPIILTIPRPKAFHPSDQPDDIPLRLSSMNVAKPIDDYINPEGAYSSSGSRSRRSMILKSKRPCPTST